MLIVIISKLHSCPCMQILSIQSKRAKETITTPLTLIFLAKFLLYPCMQNDPSISGRVVMSIPIPTHICQNKNHKTSKRHDHFTHHPHHTLSSLPPLSHSRLLPPHSRLLSQNHPLPHFLSFSIKFPPPTQVNVTSHTMITYISKSFE